MNIDERRVFHSWNAEEEKDEWFGLDPERVFDEHKANAMLCCFTDKEGWFADTIEQLAYNVAYCDPARLHYVYPKSTGTCKHYVDGFVKLRWEYFYAKSDIERKCTITRYGEVTPIRCDAKPHAIIQMNAGELPEDGIYKVVFDFSSYLKEQK